MYARDTDVSPERSKAEIEKTLARYGAVAFAYYASPKGAMVEFQAVHRRIRFVLPMPDQEDQAITHYRHGSGTLVKRSPAAAAAVYEQESRRRWRALSLVIKAKLEAVQTGVTSFEKEFMAHIVLPNNKTAGDELLPRIDEAYRTGKVPALTWEGD